MNVSMIRFKGQSRRGHGPGGRTAGSSVRTCLSLHRETRPSLIVCRHTTYDCERVLTELGLLLGPSASSGQSADPFLYPLCLPVWHSQQALSETPLTHLDIPTLSLSSVLSLRRLVSRYYTLSLRSPSLRHRDRHTRIFAVPACLSAPISTCSLRRIAPDARAIFHFII